MNKGKKNMSGLCIHYLLLPHKSPQLAGLKQHRFIISQFLWVSQARACMLCSEFLTVPQSKTEVSSECSPGGGSVSKLTQWSLAGLNSFQTVEPKTSVCCSLLAGCHGEFLVSWASNTASSGFIKARKSLLERWKL